MKELLIRLDACQEGIDWAADKTWDVIYATCPRGEWLLWLYAKTTDLTIESNLRLLTLAKGHCANTARHLMTDEKSTKAVDIAIAYGEESATREELDACATAAFAYAAAAGAAYAAAAGAAYAAAAGAAYAAAAYAGAAYAAVAAKKANQVETANIVRNVIPIDKFNI